MIGSGKLGLIREWAALVSLGDEEATDAWWFEHYDELGLLFCDPLYSPPSKYWGSCASTMLGSDAECADLACDNTRSIPDMDDYAARDVPLDIYDLRGKTSDCEDALADIIRAAWALLMANLDLVRWAACYVFGPGEREAECLVNAINGMAAERDGILDIFSDGRLTDVDIYIVSPDWAGAGVSWGLRIMVIYAGHEYWNVATSQWCCGDNLTRTCMALDVATILLHELLHYCKYDSADAEVSGTDVTVSDSCGLAYLLEGAFKWAILGRYPDLAESSCCAQFYFDYYLDLEDLKYYRFEGVPLYSLFAEGYPTPGIATYCYPTSC